MFGTRVSKLAVRERCFALVFKGNCGPEAGPFARLLLTPVLLIVSVHSKQRYRQHSGQQLRPERPQTGGTRLSVAPHAMLTPDNPDPGATGCRDNGGVGTPAAR